MLPNSICFVLMCCRYGAAGDNDTDDTPSALTPQSRDAIVSHENFSEYVNLTVKKQLETNLLPLISHMKTAFDAVVPLQSRSNLSPQQLKYEQYLSIPFFR